MDNHEYPPVDDINSSPSAPHQQHFGRKRGHGKGMKWLILLAMVLLLAVAGAAAWYFLGHKKSAPVKTVTTTTAPAAPQQPASNVQAQASGANSVYKSTTLNIAVTYPKTWTLRENADKSELALTSPATTYTKKDGTSTQGVFTLKLRNGTIPTGMVSAVNSAVAVADSVIIAYSQPTGAQRQYTNISYAGTDANNFTFLAVTGSTAFKAGQAFGGSVDLSGTVYLFAGGYGTDAGDTLAFDPVPKANYATPEVFQQAVQIIESLQIY